MTQTEAAAVLREVEIGGVTYRVDERVHRKSWGVWYPVIHLYEAAAVRAVAALTERVEALEKERGALPPWRPVETAPKDRRDVLVLLNSTLPSLSLMNDRHAGHCFVARHPGVNPDGFDVGWSLYPGLGGIPDEWIAGWMPLPAPPATEDPR